MSRYSPTSGLASYGEICLCLLPLRLLCAAWSKQRQKLVPTYPEQRVACWWGLSTAQKPAGQRGPTTQRLKDKDSGSASAQQSHCRNAREALLVLEESSSSSPFTWTGQGYHAGFISLADPNGRRGGEILGGCLCVGPAGTCIDHITPRSST